MRCFASAVWQSFYYISREVYFSKNTKTNAFVKIFVGLNVANVYYAQLRR